MLNIQLLNLNIINNLLGKNGSKMSEEVLIQILAELKKKNDKNIILHQIHIRVHSYYSLKNDIILVLFLFLNYNALINNSDISIILIFPLSSSLIPYAKPNSHSGHAEMKIFTPVSFNSLILFVASLIAIFLSAQ